MVLREFPPRFGHTGGVVTPVGSHLLIQAITQKESLSSYGRGMTVDPNVETELELTPEDLGPATCIVPTAGKDIYKGKALELQSQHGEL